MTQPQYPPDLAFTVFGLAKTAGSKKAINIPGRARPIVTDDTGAKGKAWRSQVADAGKAAMRDRPLYRCPLLVRFVFYTPRPKGHFTAKGVVKAAADAVPMKRPDVLKLARAAEDALSGIVWHDDACIVDEILAKRWGEPARLEVVIRRVFA